MGREVRDFQGARELLGRGKFSAVWVLLGFCLGLASCSGSLSFHTLGSILFSNQSSDSGHTQNQDGSPFDGIQGLSLDPADIHLILMDGQQSVEDVVSVGDTISHSITIEKDGNDISSQYFSNPALTQVFAIMNPLGVELGECESPYTQFLIESDPCEALYAGLLDVQLTDPSQFDLWVTGGLQGLTIPYFMFAMRFNTSGDVVSIAISDEMSLLQIHSQSGSGDYDIDLTQDPWTDSVEEHQLIHTGALADGSTQVIQGNDEVTFRYTGSDETISYRVNYSPGSPVAKGTVRVEELTSGSIPLAEGNVRYRSSNGGLEGPAYLPLFASIENVSVQNQKLLIDYRDPVEGQVLRRRHTYEMKGKTLRVSVEAIGDTALNRNFNGNYSGFTTGKSEQTLTPRRMYMQGTLAAPIVSFKNNGQLYFYSNQLDFLWSNASNFFLPDPYSPSLTWNTSNFSFNTGGQYEKTSAGKLAATLRESVSIVVSKNIKDVLVRSTQRVSPYRELLTQKNVVRFNDGNSDAADMIPWSDFAESMQDLYNYGADQLAFYFFFFWTGSELEGKQNVGPEWAPGHIVLNDGVHENIRTHFSNVGNSLGYMMGLYTFFGAAPSGTLPGADYSGSVFFDLCLSPFDPACIEQHILKDENGQPKIGSFSGTQWELLSDSAVLDYYIDRETQIMLSLIHI